jgi:peptide deformylase
VRIVPFPHPALRYESRPVTKIDDALRATVREMFEMMYEHRGIGLAANQVGLPFRFFILNLTADPEQPDQEQVFINPEIVKRHGSLEEEEGCLSFPGVYAKVHRAKKVRVRAYDLNGQDIEVEAEDLYGRALQHEADHLDGKLFADYLPPNVRNAVAIKIRDIELGFRKAQAAGEYPSDEEITSQLDELAKADTVPPLD